MADVVRRSGRDILRDDEELVLIKRIKPGRDPYWVTVGGGGVEADDQTIERPSTARCSKNSAAQWTSLNSPT